MELALSGALEVDGDIAKQVNAMRPHKFQVNPNTAHDTICRVMELSSMALGWGVRHRGTSVLGGGARYSRMQVVLAQSNDDGAQSTPIPLGKMFSRTMLDAKKNPKVLARHKSPGDGGALLQIDLVNALKKYCEISGATEADWTTTDSIMTTVPAHIALPAITMAYSILLGVRMGVLATLRIYHVAIKGRLGPDDELMLSIVPDYDATADKYSDGHDTEDGTSRHPEYFALVNPSIAKYDNGTQTERAYAEPGRHMLLAIVRVLIAYLEARSALPNGWRDEMVAELKAMEAARPISFGGMRPSLTMRSTKPNELMFPLVKHRYGMDENGRLPLSRFDDIEFKEVKDRASEMNLVAKRVFDSVGIYGFTYLMLRHGWLCEKRVQWSLDAKLRESENTFISYVSNWQQWKTCKKTHDYYAKMFAMLLGKWDGSSLVFAWDYRVHLENGIVMVESLGTDGLDKAWYKATALYDLSSPYYVATDSEEVLSEEAWGHFANMLSPLPDVRKLQLEALKKPYIDANDNRDHAGFLGTIAGLNATLQGEMRRAWKVRLLKLQQGFFSKATGGRK